MDNKQTDLLSLYPEELTELIISLGEPKYRAGQIFPALHKGLVPSRMTNISKATAEKIEAAMPSHMPEIEQKLVSQVDGTVKYLFRLHDGECIESVVMRYNHGNTICVSSQVGCRMGCAFCASTIGGKVRDLTAGEILGQVIVASADMGERISNIVLMGIGEPMDNYDNVLRFLHLVNDERGICIGYRHISLSTCGHVDGIRKLMKENLPITLSISLHAADDEVRDKIMPINHRWNVAELLSACLDWWRATGRRISFEYTLIDGQNSSPADAAHLAGVLNSALRGKPSRGEKFPIHVNLIPVNPVRETGLMPPSHAGIEAFRESLEKKGIRATVRRKLGPDINASCGQLRRQHKEEEKN
ncbi:MAG: 23S rRNA (adenine(2503)-C(2))-methyltransferase RlmN [Clostridia bacterium]|nr:23S rRNA (adenine(2503)-C(2))-methyltransferase RlmN [Clostridia bacterium]